MRKRNTKAQRKNFIVQIKFNHPANPRNRFREDEKADRWRGTSVCAKKSIARNPKDAIATLFDEFIAVKYVLTPNDEAKEVSCDK